MAKVGLKPFLRWAGSKRQILSVLCEYWSEGFRRYVEPFAGSASLFFYLLPKRAQISDANAALIEVYEQVRRDPERVAELIHDLPVGKKSYYEIRQIDPRSLDVMDRAARFIYLNRFCFNGLFRTNQDGHFNVPYGGKKTGSLPSAEHLKDCGNALENAELISCDFRKALDQTSQGDFVFLDPPYTTAGKRTFTEYGPNSFTSQDFYDLASRLKGMAAEGIRFVLTYEDSSEAKSLLSEYRAEKIEVRRNIAGFADERKTAWEWLITNIELPQLAGEHDG